MRILFASMPFDGHFLPMTGLAQHLRSAGHDVRFYTGPGFAGRLERLGLPHLPFRRAVEVNGDNLAEHFPEVDRLSGPRRISFDLEKIFFGNTAAHLADLREIHDEFPFEAVVNDAAFYAAFPASRLLDVPTYAICAAPSPAPPSPTAPPPFFGLRPATNPLSRLRHRIVRAMVESTTRNGMRVFNAMLADLGLPPYEDSVFQLPWDAATLVFQAGVPSMDFPRDDWPAHHRFVGPLLPPASTGPRELPNADRLSRHGSVVVVSQGTVDNRDPGKLLAPTLEALSGSDHLVVACTGGRGTAELRARFPHDNVLVEDWVDYGQLLPHARLFISNGGYGSVMQSLAAGVPLLTAGVSEGKNDINARLAFRGLGYDLRTESPSPQAVLRGIERVLGDPSYPANVGVVGAELAACRPLEAMAAAVVGRP